MLEQATRLVLREAGLLDQRRWDEWIELYADDCIYWVPSWREDGTLVEDPGKELSLIYYDGRWGLEDRIYRIRTDMSLASTPLPRSTHLITVTDARAEGGDGVIVESSWSCWNYRLEQSIHLFGRQTHVVGFSAEGPKIRHRKIIVHNDVITAPMDIYSI